MYAAAGPPRPRPPARTKAIFRPSRDQPRTKPASRQPPLSAPVRVHDVDGAAPKAGGVAPACERELRPSGDHGAAAHAVAREVPLAATVGVDDVDVGDPWPSALRRRMRPGEGDLPPVGRPSGPAVARRVARQPPKPAPVGVHDVDEVAAATVGDRRLQGDLRPSGDQTGRGREAWPSASADRSRRRSSRRGRNVRRGSS